MIRSLLLIITLSLTILFMGGCSVMSREAAGGFLFTYKKVPYTLDLNNTPTDRQNGGGRIIQVKEPFTGYGLYTELRTNAIADIARAHGMSTVYYADLEILNVLGIYGHKKLLIHGE